jgi:para-aminobenzoate synthetase component 1
MIFGGVEAWFLVPRSTPTTAFPLPASRDFSIRGGNACGKIVFVARMLHDSRLVSWNSFCTLAIPPFPFGAAGFLRRPEAISSAMADFKGGFAQNRLPAAAVQVVPFSLPEPEEAFVRLQTKTGIFWLDSSQPSPGSGRFSIMGCAPFARFRFAGGCFSFEREGATIETGVGGPWAALERRLVEYRIEPDTSRPVPFCGGAVGFFAYELGRIVEPTIGAAPVSQEIPDIELAWHDAAAVWDHTTGQSWLVGAGWRRPAEGAIAELRGWLSGALPASWRVLPEPAAPSLRANFTREDFIATVGRVRERIAAGEIYQMNLAQCFRGPLREAAPQLYRRLRRLNPAPMAAFIDTGEIAVLSSSPERFIAVEQGTIRTFPIKGTRPRGQTDSEDAAAKAALVASAKERAELLMIVDLMRNDLGRICRFGSVDVPRIHALETFATVHHLVGEVAGGLRGELTVTEILRAVFPGGSIAGAPKVRAMQLIEAMEPEPRGLFAGAIGYLGADGRIDLNIAIRTLVCRGGEVSFHVGAGIVWDSDPQAEYEETLAKGRALFAALGAPVPDAQCETVRVRTEIFDGELAPIPRDPADPAGVVGVFETLRLRAGRPEFLIEHGARYRAGCAHFNLSSAPSMETLAAAVTLLMKEDRLEDGVVRWSVWKEAGGGTHWRVRLEPPRPHMSKAILTATFATLRLPPADPGRACKHMGRGMWRDAVAAARAAGFDEAILLDDAGWVVEAGGANIFCVDASGGLQTPSLDSGPLPGVTRDQVITLARESGVSVRETRLTPTTMIAAREVFLTNALIGIRPLAAIDGTRFDAPGPVTARLQRAWAARFDAIQVCPATVRAQPKEIAP